MCEIYDLFKPTPVLYHLSRALSSALTRVVCGLALGVGHFCSNCSKWQPAPAPEARASYVKLCAPLARFGMILVAAVSSECGHVSVFYS